MKFYQSDKNMVHGLPRSFSASFSQHLCGQGVVSSFHVWQVNCFSLGTEVNEAAKKAANELHSFTMNRRLDSSISL